MQRLKPRKSANPKANLRDYSEERKKLGVKNDIEYVLNEMKA